MILTFAEDFTSNETLDSELIGTSESGLHYNRGTHPIITVENLLNFLPRLTMTFSAYASGTTYTKFSESRKRSDIVTYESKIYQSIANNNTGNTPDASSDYWLETNENSLRLKSFIFSSEDNVLSALSLNRKLIENQYIYNVGETLQILTGDYSGWAFEPKNSDYVKIRINQMSLQANTTDQVIVSVINQGALITALTLNPQNGKLVFEDIDYSFSGKGRFLFVFPSQEVLSENAYNDALKYNGFVCYPVNGIGSTVTGAEYTESSIGNGLNFNVSCYLDSSTYITNNKIDLAKFYQLQFTLDSLKMMLYNSNNRENSVQRRQSDEISTQLLAAETMNLTDSTIVKEYKRQKAIAIEAINMTFDKFLKKPTGFKVKRKVM
jgi:hypothetical protein